jgi:DNA gyrase inhibitor GyrI
MGRPEAKAEDAVASPEAMRPSRIVREPTPVAFLRTRDDPAAISQAWQLLEDMVGLRGRKFFGLVARGDEYHVCVQLRSDDDPASWELETGTIPGGLYLRTRLRGEPPKIYERIAPAMAELEAATDRDEDRPLIEFYRRRDEIELLVPARA